MKTFMLFRLWGAFTTEGVEMRPLMVILSLLAVVGCDSGQPYDREQARREIEASMVEFRNSVERYQERVKAEKAQLEAQRELFQSSLSQKDSVKIDGKTYTLVERQEMVNHLEDAISKLEDKLRTIARHVSRMEAQLAEIDATAAALKKQKDGERAAAPTPVDDQHD